jgi:hypothetical protein
VSVETLEIAISRAMVDSIYREDLKNDPREALKEYNFSPEEMEALLDGDEQRLKDMGVSDRLAYAARTGIQKVSLT